MLVCVGLGLVAAVYCRVVKVAEEADRWGSPYGALPGHPEQGEEAFVVSLDLEGCVRFEIRAFCVPPVVSWHCRDRSVRPSRGGLQGAIWPRSVGM